jgi:glutamate/tyrosine decarboxylase-like PLP-dependent enzyme
VQVAIINSEKNTPTVLKRAVHKLIEDFTENPSGFEPWNDFLAEFDVPQLKSAAKMFYSINQLGDDEATEQINRLIERNNKLVQQADDLKAENALTTMGYIVAAPMAVSILKLLTDMILLLISFVNIASNINIGI